MATPSNASTFDLEPAAIVGAVNTAIGSTLVVLALVLDWSGELTAGLTAAFTAWVAVGAVIVRSKVRPVVSSIARPPAP